MIGGGSRVPMDVAPYTMTAGNPLRTCGLNVRGLSRRGFSPASIDALHRAYRIFFREKLGVSEALGRIRAEVPAGPEVEHLIAFILSSERGITR